MSVTNYHPSLSSFFFSKTGQNSKFPCQLLAYPYPPHIINKSTEDPGYSISSEKLYELVISMTHKIKSLGIQIMHRHLDLQQTL